MCRTHPAGDDRPRQPDNRGLHRWCQGVRFDLQEINVRRLFEDGRRRSDPPIRPCFYLTPRRICGKTSWERHREEGGEQGDPFMPMLFLLCGSIEHWRQLRIACVTARNCSLSSTTSTCRSGRAAYVLIIVEEELTRAHQFASGQTQMCNQSGVVPAGIEAITRAARMVKPDAIVWRGDEEWSDQSRHDNSLNVTTGWFGHV